MPDNEYFGEEKQARAIEWLKKLPKEKQDCDMCGGKKWSVCPELVSPNVFSSNSITLNFSYPQLMITCNSCGNTKYINAQVAGLLETNGGDSEEI